MERGELENFFKLQLSNWETASNNYASLNNVLKKPFRLKDFTGYVQYNPGRKVSSLAKVDKESVKNRSCFLCKENRPVEQNGIEIIEGWELLINPFPILPFHFTIASLYHIPQKLSIETGFKLAQNLSGMVVFYNDDGAGASAPDHQHFQAVPYEELPLIKLIQERDFEIDYLSLPFRISLDPEESLSSNHPQNSFFWKDSKGNLHFLGIPRKTHRPRQFYLSLPDRRAVSPGALDMAGIIVTPYLEDYKLIDEKDIENIFSQVGFTNEQRN